LSYRGLVATRRRRFQHDGSEIVWAAIETLDPGLQYEVLRELATAFAHAGGDPQTSRDKVRAAVVALHEVAGILRRSPTIEEYRAVRHALPELGLPPDSTIRRWLGARWNGCLTRALLDAVADGDFASRPVGTTDRYEDAEVFAALRECADDLGHPPTMGEYLQWAHRPDVLPRSGRRPLSYRPFERFGRHAERSSRRRRDQRERGTLRRRWRLLPLRYAYSEQDMTQAPGPESRAQSRTRSRRLWRACAYAPKRSVAPRALTSSTCGSSLDGLGRARRAKASG